MSEENRNHAEVDSQINNADSIDQEKSDAKGMKYVLLFVMGMIAIVICVAGFYCTRCAVEFGYTTVKILQCATAPDPDVPVIRRAEFPITVTYEDDGEVKTVYDTLVCEFDGYVWESSDYARHRKWNYHLESGKYITLFQGAEHYVFVLKVDCSAAWMMGDEEEAPSEGGEPSYLIGISFGEAEKFYPYDEDEFYQDMSIKVLDFEVAPPIENTFVPAE